MSRDGLKILKASAGSGKTHTLAEEYLSILLSGNESSSLDKEAYKHVLAITFTNKATEEMKSRVIEKLDELSREDSVRGQKAKKVLTAILHDYSAFSVSTIDKFFQSVMRSFAREIGEYASYKVELDAELESARKRVAELEHATVVLTQEKDALQKRLAEAEKNAESADELSRVKDELAKVQSAQAARLAEADEKVRAAEEKFKLELEEARAHSSSVSVLLDRPAEFPEVFPGEVREHVLASLKEAYGAAERGGRERRAGILEGVLAANSSTGELDRRREEVKRIVRDGGRFVDDSVISELARLGFRYVSGSNHHKLVYAGVRVTLSKTPSDHRATLNNSAEINNLVY